MNKDRHFKVLEENQETLLAIVSKLEHEVKDLRILVREILHAMKKTENRRQEKTWVTRVSAIGLQTRSAGAPGLWRTPGIYALGATPIPGPSGRTRRPRRTAAPLKGSLEINRLPSRSA